MASSMLWALSGAALLVSGTFRIADARIALSLDGTWSFALDPKDNATRRLVAQRRKVDGDIKVPGAWQAQGFGEETATLMHQYMGVATYTRKISLPKISPSFNLSNQRSFLVAERIQRAAKLYVGGKFICSHTGYLSNLDCEVTAHADGNSDLAIALAVNSTRDVGYDGLQGAEDLEMAPDGTNMGGWGGLAGHVRLEARSKMGYITEPWIKQNVDKSFKSATVSTQVTLAGASDYTGLSLHVTYIDSDKRTVGTATAHCKAAVCETADVTVDSPALWSPKSTAQYDARIELRSSSNQVVDSELVQFGFRKLETVGYHWKLNGVWLYLNGYGDDSIYPDTLAPPTDKDFYISRLKFTQGLGMNWARHHSHILPDEFFEAACEVGMMISAEFPLGYGGSPGMCPGSTCNKFYLEQWTAIIKRIRNRPCLFDYTVDNEDNGEPLGKTMYTIAKDLDPDRPVNTADGIFSAATGPVDGPQDFYPHQENVGVIALGSTGLYRFDSPPPVPVINHEMGNFVSFPLFDTQIARFNTDTVKPYWLTPARDHYQDNGLLAENELWTQCSNHLYRFCWKNTLEALRKTEQVSGYEWWLVQDFWMGSNGIMDTYFVPKHSQQEIDTMKNMNADVMLLIAEPGDNLELDGKAARFLRAYASKDTMATSVHISNYGATDITGSRLLWQVTGSREREVKVVLCEGFVLPHALPQGPGITKLLDIECPLPDLGTSADASKMPMTLSLEVTLEGVQTETLAYNSWRSRMYPIVVDSPSPKGWKVYTSPAYCQFVPINDMTCNIPSSEDTKLGRGSLLVVDTIDADILAFAAAGATVLMLKGSDSAKFGALPTDPANFKTAWWLGSATDTNMGTVVYNASKPITEGMAPEGWADEGWFGLVDGAQNFILDGQIQKGAEILIRSIDIMGEVVNPVPSLQDNPYKVLSRNKALMWQTSVVPSGSNVNYADAGVLIASGLNLLVNSPFPSLNQERKVEVSSRGRFHRRIAYGLGGGVTKPDAAWVLHKTLAHAFSGPRPLKNMEARVTNCPECVPAKTWTLCDAKETMIFM